MIRVCIFTLSKRAPTKKEGQKISHMGLVEFFESLHFSSGNVFINLGAN